MPALVAFGRRWQVGSDDFVVPGFLDLLIRISWLIAAVVIYWKNDTNLNLECEGGFYMKIYLYGVFAILHLIIITDVALVHNSKAGVMMDTEARKYVALILYCRLLFEMAEVGWTIVGTIGATYDRFVCTTAQEAETLIQGLIISNWVLISLWIISIFVIFDPIGGYHYTVVDDGVADSKLTKSWERRFRRYCCPFTNGKHANVKEAFAEAGYLFGSMFEDSDLVPSDVGAGMIILFLRNEELKRNIKEVKVAPAITSIEDKPPSGVITTQPVPMVGGPIMESWTSLPLLHHFLKYGMATYTWPIMILGHSKPIKNLWGESLCCGCIPCRQKPFDIEGDNCCFLNTSALKGLTQLDNCDIIYASFQNSIFKTPFCIAVDHPTKSIVIAIRGTMSTNDIITDLNGSPYPVDIPGLPDTFRAHHGMLRCARRLKERLDSLKVLPKLFTTHPDYNLVITGTSLGAGTGTILSMIMKADYPNLKCYAYSPPGGLLSLDASKYCKSFVISVIYGDDFVPRIGIFSLEKWKYQIIAAINECKTPKYRVLMGGCYWLGGGSPKLTFDESADFRKDSRSQLIGDEQETNSSVVNVENDPDTNTINSSRSSQIIDLPPVKKLQPFEPLYPPGNLLYITETESFDLGHNNRKYNGPSRWSVRWAKKSEFREMIISPRMVADHVPFRMYKSLYELSTKGSDSIELNPSNFSVIGNVLKSNPKSVKQ